MEGNVLPTGGLSLSSPWIAQAAGSSSVDSSSVKLWILYNFDCLLQKRVKVSYSASYFQPVAPRTIQYTLQNHRRG